MYLPLSFKKHEQNIWLNWPLDWKLDCNRGGSSVQDSIVSVYTSLHLSKNDCSLFSYLFWATFQKASKFYQALYVSLLKTEWDHLNTRGIRDYFFQFLLKFWPSNNLLPSTSHHYVLSEPQGVGWVYLPLPWLVF